MRFFALAFLFLISIAASGQDYVLPFDRLSQLRQDRAGIGFQEQAHTAAKPILFSSIDVTNIQGLGDDTTTYYFKINEKIFSEHLIEMDKLDFQLAADFLFDFAYGQELIDEVSDERSENSLFQNTRGFLLQGKIGDRVYFYTDFRENQGRYPAYVNVFVDSLGIMPGSGRVKEFKEDGYDYSMASGFVGIEAADWLDLSFGHFKQFIGHGYRSLLLSDNAHNYPFASYDLNLLQGRIKHRYTLALMQDLERLPQGETPESIFKRKVSNWNYLSFKPIKNLEIGIFEQVIWKVFDDSLGSQPFDYRALIPLPGLNSAILGLEDEENNALLGLNLAWFPVSRWRIYGQMVFDNNQLEPNGFQLGSRFASIWNRFDAQVEYNRSEWETGGVPGDLQANFHFNQPLGHPLASGFEEIYTELTFYHKRIFVLARVNIQRQLGDSPIKNDRNIYRIQPSYVFNPSSNMMVYAGYTFRVSNAMGDNAFWSIGIRTSLNNRYTDF